MKIIFIIFTLLFLPLAVQAADTLRTITVEGQAEEDFIPDIAKFTVNIAGHAMNREEAKASHDKMLRTLLELAKKYNIEEKDLNTGFSTLNPNYDYQNGKRKLVDYSTQTQINITLRNIKSVSQFQDDLVASGFDNFQGPNYSLDKLSTYNDKVLANAVINAKQKATAIALKMGEIIDRPVDIREEGPASNIQQPIIAPRAEMTLSALTEKAVAQPAGVINIRTGVIATFNLKNN